MEKLKDNPDTRHIPVHFISGRDEGQDAKRMGAIGYLLKPVNMDELNKAFGKIEHFIDKNIRYLLIMVDDTTHRQKILDIVDNENINIVVVNTQEESYQCLQGAQFDCIIVDIDVAKGQCIQLLGKLEQKEDLAQIPIIVYADRYLTVEENEKLSKYSHHLTLKAVHSPERLLDEATLFLHQIEADLPQEKRHLLHLAHNKEAVLMNKKVLLVDDDVRNTFALETVLAERGMEVIVANNGLVALDLITQHKNVDIVLMDIMMPEMDGYETTKAIRLKPGYRQLPIIALTAKAMKGDKAKCIEAGANDYLAKPVDIDKLISLMRVWLHK
jgi:CheY-like chemotaxis protein